MNISNDYLIHQTARVLRCLNMGNRLQVSRQEGSEAENQHIMLYNEEL